MKFMNNIVNNLIKTIEYNSLTIIRTFLNYEPKRVPIKSTSSHSFYTLHIPHQKLPEVLPLQE